MQWRTQLINQLTKDERRSPRRRPIHRILAHRPLQRVMPTPKSIIGRLALGHRHLPLPIRPRQLDLQPFAASQPIQVLCEPVQTVDRVFVRPSTSFPVNVRIPKPGRLDCPFRLRLCEVLFQRGERSLVRGDGFLEMRLSLRRILRG